MSFDIRSYAASARPVADDDVDYDAFASQPVSDDALRALQYFCDVESHTICYLRDLLVTPSHKDPEITAFLTMWAYEEHWHGEALAKVLRAHGRAADDAHLRDFRLSLGAADRYAPILQASLANLIGEDFVAVHMTFGAINEWSTHAGYGRMMDQEPHPEFRRLLGRIQQQETRHLAFYASQARERLARSARARRVTRFIVKNFWTPVGSSIMPRSETAFLLNYLMGGPEGQRVIERLDDKIDRFPGLEGLRLVARAAGGFGIGELAGAARRSWGGRLRAYAVGARNSHPNRPKQGQDKADSDANCQQGRRSATDVVR